MGVYKFPAQSLAEAMRANLAPVETIDPLRTVTYEWKDVGLWLHGLSVEIEQHWLGKVIFRFCLGEHRVYPRMIAVLGPVGQTLCREDRRFWEKTKDLKFSHRELFDAVRLGWAIHIEF